MTVRYYESKRFYYGKKCYPHSTIYSALRAARAARQKLEAEHPAIIFNIYDNGDYLIVSSNPKYLQMDNIKVTEIE